MAEQRLIDANEVRKKIKNSRASKSVKVESLVFVDCAPTIDPETLPIVQQLRAELSMVKTERDAAVHDLEKAMSLEWEKGEGDVIEFLCSVCSTKECGGICKPKWRGQKEILNNG